MVGCGSLNPGEPFLNADAHVVLSRLFYGACAVYGVAWLATLMRPTWGRPVATVAVALHMIMTVGRGWVIGFLPLTNKMESFSAVALALGVVAVITWVPRRVYAVGLLTAALAALAVAWNFGLGFSYPVALLLTPWYALHVPLSFLAYGLWTAAALAGVVWFCERSSEWLHRCEWLMLVGFGLWSLSMVAGGIWGVLAWGAYFLWDPKVIWSVILWFHYASALHVRFTPSLMEWPAASPAMAMLGFVWVFVAYVGTSFFFGVGSHAF